MFERFTDTARRAVITAQEEARSCNHDGIDTEHLLLSIIKNETSVARILQRFTSYDDISRQIEKRHPKGVERPMGHIAFAPLNIRALELAVHEAQQYGQSGDVSDSHVLLGLLRLGAGTAFEVLSELDVDVAELRRQTEEQLGIPELKQKAKQRRKTVLASILSETTPKSNLVISLQAIFSELNDVQVGKIETTLALRE